jgi:hypothetical protein
MISRRPAMIPALVLLVTTISPCSAAQAPSSGHNVTGEQGELVAEGWRRLTMQRHYTRAQMERAWDPIVEAVSPTLADPGTWSLDEDRLDRKLEAVITEALGEGRLGFVRACASTRARGDRDVLVVTFYAACRVGDVPTGQSMAPMVTLLFWRVGPEVRHEYAWDLQRPTGTYFEGDGHVSDDDLVLVGYIATGNRAQPAILVYRYNRDRWGLLQRVVGDDSGSAELTAFRNGHPPDIDVAWYRWNNETLGTPHAGPHRYYDEKWAFRKGRYHRTSRWLVRTPFVALDDFYRMLREGDRSKCAAYVADPALIQRATDVGLADRKRDWRLCCREMVGDEWTAQLARDFGEPTLAVRMRKSNGRWVITDISPIPAHTDAGGS